MCVQFPNVKRWKVRNSNLCCLKNCNMTAIIDLKRFYLAEKRLNKGSNNGNGFYKSVKFR